MVYFIIKVSLSLSFYEIRSLNSIQFIVYRQPLLYVHITGSPRYTWGTKILFLSFKEQAFEKTKDNNKYKDRFL